MEELVEIELLFFSSEYLAQVDDRQFLVENFVFIEEVENDFKFAGALALGKIVENLVECQGRLLAHF